MNVEPLLIEPGDGYITHWFVPVPDEGVPFQVLRDHWRDTDKGPIREILEIKVKGRP